MSWQFSASTLYILNPPYFKTVHCTLCVFMHFCSVQSRLLYHHLPNVYFNSDGKIRHFDVLSFDLCDEKGCILTPSHQLCLSSNINCISPLSSRACLFQTTKALVEPALERLYSHIKHWIKGESHPKNTPDNKKPLAAWTDLIFVCII